jgi:CheY-like chemotaxis protein
MKKPLPGTRPKILQKRILVAEDEPGVREALVLLLSLDGHTVTPANDGKQALEIFQRERFDVVITDYMMPEMKGDELAANINRLKPEQPVIMVSAHAQTLAESGNPLAGVGAVVGKPFMLADLRDAIAKVLADQEDSGDTAFLPN